MISFEMIDGTPRYICTNCSNCRSLMGTSLCSIKHRGCCSYFPEFSLRDIQIMTQSLEGSIVLETILKQPGTIIYPYHIHAKGAFDRDGYNEYLKREPLDGSENINDHSIFFRTCPFVKGGLGCTLPVKYRNYICNLYLCNEVITAAVNKEAVDLYVKESRLYSRWLDLENEALRHILKENGKSLVKDFSASLNILRDIPTQSYEFPELKPVELIGEYNMVI